MTTINTAIAFINKQYVTTPWDLFEIKYFISDLGATIPKKIKMARDFEKLERGEVNLCWNKTNKTICFYSFNKNYQYFTPCVAREINIYLSCNYKHYNCIKVIKYSKTKFL